jgi:hypothetical protein
MNLKDMVFEGVEWIRLARDRDKWRDVEKKVKDNMVA